LTLAPTETAGQGFRMDVVELLSEDKAEILEDAWRSVAKITHYERDGAKTSRQRLETLLDHVTAAILRRDLGDLLDYAEQVARQRFEAGYDLCEVQTAFFMLEEAMWRRILSRIPPADLAESLGLVATAIGRGKDALGRAYVSLATSARAPSFDLSRLFKGT
jgi:hypothetical protein